MQECVYLGISFICFILEYPQMTQTYANVDICLAYLAKNNPL